MDQPYFHTSPVSSHGGSIQDLNKGLLALNLDSVTLKKLSQSGIKDFIPLQSGTVESVEVPSNKFQPRHQVCGMHIKLLIRI